MPLAGGKHRGHDDGAGMHRAAFEGVVEVLAMRRRAIDESGARRVEQARMADHGADAFVVKAGQRARDVVLIARGDAETDHVDHEILAFARRQRRKHPGLHGGDLVGKRLGD